MKRGVADCKERVEYILATRGRWYSQSMVKRKLRGDGLRARKKVAEVDLNLLAIIFVLLIC